MGAKQKGDLSIELSHQGSGRQHTRNGRSTQRHGVDSRQFGKMSHASGQMQPPVTLMHESCCSYRMGFFLPT